MTDSTNGVALLAETAAADPLEPSHDMGAGQPDGETAAAAEPSHDMGAGQPDGETAEPEHQGDGPDEPDTFTREYVTELRRESADRRTRLAAAETRADELAAALWTERVSALGLLADPADLPFDAAALDDTAAIRALADELLTARPHLRTRRITARAGQGEGQQPTDAVSLTGIMRARA
jgi:hypothetical protein